MSMLKYCFSCQHQGRELFQGLAIEQDVKLMAEQGQHPVIHIGLKDCQRDNFASFVKELSILLARLFADLEEQHNGQSVLKSSDLQRWQRLCTQQGDLDDLMDSLRLCSQLLHKTIGKPTIILIDEYDAPLLDVAFRTIMNVFAKELRLFLVTLVHYLSWGSTV